jgi:hypothetical protein
MPAITAAANHRYRRHDGRRYHGRRYDSRGRRRYHRRGYDNRGGGCNYDRSVRVTSSVRTAVKSGTTTIRSTGAVHADE